MNMGTIHPEMNCQFPILLVEDDYISRKIMEKTLSEAGYEVTPVENGRKALAIFQDRYFPIVLTDWMMPEMDGLELCQRIRSLNTSEYTFIVFLTTKDSQADIIDGLNAGADDYLIKPADPVEVAARLSSARRVLKLERSMREANERLQNHLNFQKTLIQTMPNPFFYKDVQGAYLGCNGAWASQILGVPPEAVVGRTPLDFPDMMPGKLAEKLHHHDLEMICSSAGAAVFETRLKCADGIRRDFLINKATFTDSGGDVAGLIGVMMDISEKNQLLKSQEMNIGQAKNIMGLINTPIPRHTDISDEISLFADAISVPCNAEGGDHFFIRNLGESEENSERIVVSLKDQSGHEVGCILRSIITDLIHNAILTHDPQMFLESVISKLNDEICGAGLFPGQDFFTAMDAEIASDSLILRYISSGHPPFFLIRGTDVRAMPGSGKSCKNLPLGVISGSRRVAGTYQLREGDKLIFYTDGLLEMPLRKLGKVIRLDALSDMIRDILAQAPEMRVSDIIRKLLATVAERSHEQVIPSSKNTSGDDVTIIGLEIENRRYCREIIWKPKNSEDISRRILRLCGTLKKEWKAQGYVFPERRLRIGLEEILINAWTHGNHRDPDKSLTIRWRYGNDFIFEVIDEGQGFDYKRIDDPRLKQNLTRPCGRGIFFIRAVADSVRWRKDGKHIITSFMKHPEDTRKKQGQIPENIMNIWEKRPE